MLEPSRRILEDKQGIKELERGNDRESAGISGERFSSELAGYLLGEPAGVLKGRFSPEPVGYVLSHVGLICLLSVLGLSIWIGQTGVTILVGLTLTAALVSKLWSRFSLARLYCTRELSETRLFPGEYVDLNFRVTNSKILPLPWLQVYDEVPTALAKGVPDAVENYPGSFSISYTAVLPWYSSVSWKRKLLCSKRGYYTLGPATVTSGDILGFYPRSEYRRETNHLIVYPRLYLVDEVILPALYPLGETKSSRRIFEDPTRPIGVRDYNYQDSLRHIHWKASAHHQKLEVKVFEPTVTLKVVFFLAVDSFPLAKEGETDYLELGVSAVASLSRYLIEHRSPTGVFSNSRLAELGGPVRILPGSDKGHLVNILEGLARVTPFPTVPFPEFFESERVSLPWGATLVLIVSEPMEKIGGILTELKKRGNKLLILQVGHDSDLKGFHGIPVCRIREPKDLRRVNFKEAA